MSSRLKIHNNYNPYFITSTVIQWMDALSRPQYKDLLVDSLRYSIINKGLQLHAWVIMSNHFHIIASCEDGNTLSNIMRDIKKFTSRKIIEAIRNNSQESRKQWLMNAFSYAGKYISSNEQYQFWQPDFHPVELTTEEIFLQKLNYLHDNPVRAGIVWKAEDYVYSSACDWMGTRKGSLPLVEM